MATKTQNQTYLEVAKDLAASVIQPRGLLRKGVGLCHGVSGNSFCFLSLANAMRELQGDGHTASEWINAACEYANFAVDILTSSSLYPIDHFHSTKAWRGCHVCY
jgi:hypothetical protein